MSGGFIFLPSLSIVPQWWDKRRGRAYGVISLGSSAGGTLLPIILPHLLNGVGFQWTIRILGFINLVLMVVFNLTVRPRLYIAKKDRPPSSVKDVLDYPAFLVSVGASLY